MSLNLSTNSLRTLLALTEKREALVAELQKIELEISSAFLGNSVGNTGITAKGHKTGKAEKGAVRSKPPSAESAAPSKN